MLALRSLRPCRTLRSFDSKAQNTAGGTFTSGADRTRDLNLIEHDDSHITSISSNQFTLQTRHVSLLDLSASTSSGSTPGASLQRDIGNDRQAWYF
jgi:hypothetical protein